MVLVTLVEAGAGKIYRELNKIYANVLHAVITICGYTPWQIGYLLSYITTSNNQFNFLAIIIYQNGPLLAKLLK